MCAPESASITCPRKWHHHGLPEVSGTHLEKCPSFKPDLLNTLYLSIDMSMLLWGHDQPTKGDVPAEGDLGKAQLLVTFPSCTY